MELTIHVPDDIKVQAEACGLAPEPYAEQLVNKGLAEAELPRDLASVRAAAARIRELRKENTLGGISIKDSSTKAASIDGWVHHRRIGNSSLVLS